MPLKDPPRERARKTQPRYRRANGDRVPRVSAILGVLDKPALVRWAWRLGTQGVDIEDVRRETASAGTLAHEAIAAELGGPSVDADYYTATEQDGARAAIIQWRAWRAEHEVQPVLIEQPLVSEQLGYGGTPDVCAYVDGRLEVIDFKTSRRVYDNHVVQLAAYWNLLRENGYEVQALRVLAFPRDGSEWSERVETDIQQPWAIFFHALQIHAAMAAMKQGARGQSAPGN